MAQTDASNVVSMDEDYDQIPDEPSSATRFAEIFASAVNYYKPDDALRVFMTAVSMDPMIGCVGDAQKRRKEKKKIHQMIAAIQPEIYHWSQMVDVCVTGTYYYAKECDNMALVNIMRETHIMYDEYKIFLEGRKQKRKYVARKINRKRAKNERRSVLVRRAARRARWYRKNTVMRK